MHTPPEQSATIHVPLAVRWSRLRAAYRMANLATHHVLGFTVKLALLVYFVLAVVFLFLRYAILPNIDYYKGHIEQAAGRALGNPVAIARIYASWHGLRPSLFLGDVSLRDKDGRQALSLPSVSATLSWWSLLYGTVRFETLEIIRPDLDVRRAPDGKLYVAGMPIDLDARGDGKGADWLLAQHHVSIREGKVRWTDGLYGRPELALENVNFVMRNQWRTHRFGLQATPPAAMAAPIDVRANFTHPAFAPRISDVSMWKGELYADLNNADLALWRQHVGQYGGSALELSQGKGALRAWISLDHARLAGFTADLHLSGVGARLGKDLPQLDLVRVDGRISAKEDFSANVPDGKPTFGARGHAVELTDFSLETSDGLSLPPTSLSERFVAASKGKPQRTEIKARLLDLQTLAALAGRLPLTAPQRRMLAEAAPRGRLQDFSAEWQGELPALQSYRIRGRVDGLGVNPLAASPAQPKSVAGPAVAATPALPGFDNLSGSIDASDQGGTVRLASRDLVLRMPAWFEDALPFASLDLQARWMLEDNKQLRVQLERFEFDQQGLTGSFSGSHVLPLGGNGGNGSAGGAGTIDLNGTLDNFDVKTIGRYLPLQTPHNLQAWLTGALEGGTARDVSVRLRGDLAHFPFKADTAAQRGAGEFRIAGKLDDAKLNYSPGNFAVDGKAPLWPQAEHIKGSFVFDRARMEIHGDTATTAGAALSAVKAVIPDLTAHDMLLDIDGNAAAPMQEFLNYVAASPVLGWIDHFTDETTASGNAKLALKLHLPLNHMLDATVQGSVQLMNNDVVLLRDLPPVQGGTGKIEFNEKGVNLNNLAGSMLGGPIAITGGSQKDRSIQVRIAGTMTTDGLRKNYPAPVMQRLTGHLNGAMRYSGLITARDHQLVVAVDSTLAGLGLDFPAPLKKAAAESLPVKFVLTGNAANEAGVRSDEIRIAIGSNVSARYQRQKQGKDAWRLLRGGIGVNVPAPEPDSGLLLNVNMKTLDADAWIAAASGIAGPSSAPGAGGTESAPDAADGPDIAQYVIPDAMAARAGQLLLGERKLDNVVVGATHQKDVWQANIEAQQVAGYVTWIETPSGLGKMTARLSSLTIPEADAAEVKNLLESKSAAQSIPSLDIIADKFELFNKPLGRLELRAYNTIAGGAREWRIGKLELANPDGAFKGSGKWTIKDGQSNTSLNFDLDIIDAGKLLDRFGFAETVRRGKGKMSGDIAWKGLPYSLDIPTLSGQIQMNVESGQFLKQDPGAAKLLGVLSLQALPRLLKLDFHDVFSEGLAFDGISANASINRGVVKTDNLKMHGVAATVLMDGSADIANESTNLHVVVIPEFNLGTGPLVYALAVNPVIGLGSFLAQLFLRAPVMKALTYHMQVKGPWKAPLITKLDGDKTGISPQPSTNSVQ